jgi:hypothetical protein
MKVDVAIQIYGKPWQSLCSLFSLAQHSGTWIDTIYVLEEPKHPFGDSLRDFLREIKRIGPNIIHKNNKKACPSSPTPPGASRDEIRYQWAFDHSDKQYLFITHNDVLYHSDVIGEMLSSIGECVAIGEIGQCWNCPALHLCGGGQHWSDWNPSIEDILTLPLPHKRTMPSDIDINHPKLMPECRVNEWSILINREICAKEGEPYFGHFKLDTGTEWFKAMHRRGYSFKHHAEGFRHCYFSSAAGYRTQQKSDLYRQSEQRAKAYFKANYLHVSHDKENGSRRRRLLRTIHNALSRLMPS